MNIYRSIIKWSALIGIPAIIIILILISKSTNINYSDTSCSGPTTIQVTFKPNVSRALMRDSLRKIGYVAYDEHGSKSSNTYGDREYGKSVRSYSANLIDTMKKRLLAHPQVLYSHELSTNVVIDMTVSDEDIRTFVLETMNVTDSEVSIHSKRYIELPYGETEDDIKRKLFDNPYVESVQLLQYCAG